MPEYQEPPQLQPADFEAMPALDPEKSLADNEALTLVKADFAAYEAFRQTNHDKRWTQNDALYFGNVPQRLWEGTTTPRSSLPWPISFDHVETAYPAIIQAVFGTDPWFQVAAGEGATPQDAQDKQDELLEKLSRPRYGYGVSGIRELCRAIRSGLLYGNGGVEIKWDAEINDGCIEWVDLRDFYFDPSTPTPHVDDGRSVIRRKFFSVSDLKAMRDTPGMDIPPDNILNTLARAPQAAAADSTKRLQEGLRGVQYSPQMSGAPQFPADRRVEVLIYYSKSRCIWVLDRRWVAYNEKNPYGFIPFAFFPCYEVLGRFYAMSVPDRLEENQRYIEALRNLRLDAINLDIMPPKVMNRAMGSTPSQMYWTPGKTVFSDGPRAADSVQEFRPTSMNANITEEVAQIEMESERRTGISALQQGIPRPGNANRTSGGMQMQMQGATMRLSSIVLNIEDYLIVPALYKLNALIDYHKQAEQEDGQDVTLANLASGDQGAQQAVSNRQESKKALTFTISAASRMMRRDALLQVLPLYFQFVLQGPFMQELARTGKTIDEMQLFRMIQDATGVNDLYALIRPMTPQEQQMMQQPDPQTAAKLQQAQMEQQTRVQIMQQKSQTDLQKTAMVHDHQTNLADEKNAVNLLQLLFDHMQQNKQASLQQQAQAAGLMGGQAPQGPPQGGF